MNPALTFEWGAISWSPSFAALVAAGLLLALMILTIERANRRLAEAPGWRRILVGVLNVVATFALIALLAPPGLEREVDGQVTLLTEGALASREPGPQTYRLAELADTNDTNDSEARELVTPGQLLLRHPNLDALHIVGHGLDERDWMSLPSDLDVSFEPPPITGPVGVAWRPVIDTGQALIITGALQLPGEEQVAEMRLIDPSGVVAASASARSGQAFSLTTTPRAPGALTYRLEVRRGENVLSDDPVGVFVRPESGAQLLVVQSAPSFETRQLGAWAADSGNALVVHSRISQDRDLVQGVNLPGDAPLDRSSTLLGQTDLVVVDGRRWTDFDGGERQRMLDAVREGMGLLLLVDEELADWLATETGRQAAGVRVTRITEPSPAWPAWAGADPERPLIRAPWRLEREGARSLTLDETGDLLETWQPFGAGRIAVSVVRERHRWATSGEGSLFGRYWSRMTGLIGRGESRARWSQGAGVERLRPGTRWTFCSTPGEAPHWRWRPQGSDAWSEPIALVAPASGTPLTCGAAWPAEPGWHQLQLLGGDDGALLQDEVLVHVYDSHAWRAHAFQRRQSATLKRTGIQASTDTRSTRTPVSPWWAWAMLLLAGSLLWLERRLHQLT